MGRSPTRQEGFSTDSLGIITYLRIIDLVESILKTLLFLILFTVALSGNVYANGGGYFLGISGNEISVPNVMPTKNLIISEEVVLDAPRSRVTVRYFIKNNKEIIVPFRMLASSAESVGRRR